MKLQDFKIYDAGYAAPFTEDVDRCAVLEMEAPLVGHSMVSLFREAPPFITLRLAINRHFYEGGATVERRVNGQSAGVTPLYQPGHVLCDGSENLKPLSKLRAIDFIYEGRGVYWDEEESRSSFYPGHEMTHFLQLTLGQVVFQKPFAGQLEGMRLETYFKRQEREEWTDVIGYGRETYPLYPYGGYIPPLGDLNEVEPVYALAGMDQKAGKPVTALKLYRHSFLQQAGGSPPEPLTMDHKKWVFPQHQSPLELMTVGQALREGCLTFVLKPQEGESYSYRSYGYEQIRGGLHYIHVHYERV